MPKLEFYDIKTRTKFSTDKYNIVVKSGRTFAVAISPSGIKAHRIVATGFKK